MTKMSIRLEKFLLSNATKNGKLALPILGIGSAAATIAVVISRVQVSVRHTGRAKFTHGERHTAEHSAGIVIARLDAFLIGNAILGCLNEILGGTNDANDRENAERNGEITAHVTIHKRTTHTPCYLIGDLAAATATTAIRFLFVNVGVQNDGIDDLQSRYMIGK